MHVHCMYHHPQARTRVACLPSRPVVLRVRWASPAHAVMGCGDDCTARARCEDARCRASDATQVMTQRLTEQLPLECGTPSRSLTRLQAHTTAASAQIAETPQLAAGASTFARVLRTRAVVHSSACSARSCSRSCPAMQQLQAQRLQQGAQASAQTGVSLLLCCLLVFVRSCAAAICPSSEPQQQLPFSLTHAQPSRRPITFALACLAGVFVVLLRLLLCVNGHVGTQLMAAATMLGAVAAGVAAAGCVVRTELQKQAPDAHSRRACCHRRHLTAHMHARRRASRCRRRARPAAWRRWRRWRHLGLHCLRCRACTAKPSCCSSRAPTA